MCSPQGREGIDIDNNCGPAGHALLDAPIADDRAFLASHPTSDPLGGVDHDTIAHDLHNLLGTIQNFTHFARAAVERAARGEQVADWSEVLGDLGKVRAATARATILVDQLGAAATMPSVAPDASSPPAGPTS